MSVNPAARFKVPYIAIAFCKLVLVGIAKSSA